MTTSRCFVSGEPFEVGDLEAVRDATVFSSAAEYLDDELGPESRDEWLTAVRERGN